jgi:hypothetical protein
MVWSHLPGVLSMLASDASKEWDPPSLTPDEIETCAGERAASEACLPRFETFDVCEAAKLARYQGKHGKPGKLKRTRYPLVDLSERQVVVMVHQTGMERSARRTAQTAHKFTCHRLVSTNGDAYRCHPANVRLIAGNRFDRHPWAAVHIETLGNFERIDGTGTWHAPDSMGRGRASDTQILGVRAAIVDLQREVASLGGRIVAAVPHCIAGLNEHGKPNRQACPGSRLHAEAVEWAGAELGLAVPGPDFSIGGVVVDERWHGPFWGRCENLLQIGV